MLCERKFVLAEIVPPLPSVNVRLELAGVEITVLHADIELTVTGYRASASSCQAKLLLLRWC